MEYNIQFNEEEQTIHVTAHGKRNVQTDNAMVEEIIQKVVDTGLRKVLIDIRKLDFDLSMAELFQRAKYVREKRLKKGKTSSKVALVYNSGNPKLDSDMQFFETTARNRGLPYHVFSDMEKAKNWLQQE